MNKVDLFDIEKDGIYYKKLAGNFLMVLRRIGYSNWWKTEKHVGYDTFYSSQTYTDIAIPKEVDGMKVISVESYSSTIKNVTFPETINSFGNSLCNISNVVFPSSVTDSHYESVRSCNNIIIPSSVQTVDTVSGCNMLSIPSSVISIKYIQSSVILKMESPIPPVLSNWWATDDSVLLVPIGAIEAYKNDSQWGKCKNIREDPTLGNGATSIPQQTSVANNGAAEKEIAELKQQLAKKDEEIAVLKNQLAKKDEEIAQLKQQSESKKASAEPKPQPAPAQPKPVQPSAPTNATAAVPKANGVFKLADYKSKGKLCHAIVKTYVEQHPDVTLAQLKQAFNVPKCEVVESLAVALTIKDSMGKVGGDYYIKENDQLKAKDGMVVVWSYWPERFYNPFMERVKTLGYTIE